MIGSFCCSKTRICSQIAIVFFLPLKCHLLSKKSRRFAAGPIFSQDLRKVSYCELPGNWFLLPEKLLRRAAKNRVRASMHLSVHPSAKSVTPTTHHTPDIMRRRGSVFWKSRKVLDRNGNAALKCYSEIQWGFRFDAYALFCQFRQWHDIVFVIPECSSETE